MDGLPEPSGTRERIVMAAMKLFYEHGFNATTLNDVARAARANAGSLYYFFKTKDDLLLAVLDNYVQLLWPAVMTGPFEQTEDPIEKIFAVFERYRQGLIQTGCTRGCPIGNLALEVGDAKPAAREKIALNFANWCKAIQQCLDAAAPRLPPDIDREKLSRFVLTVLEGGIMQARGHRSTRPFEEAVEFLRDYFNRLLKK